MNKEFSAGSKDVMKHLNDIIKKMGGGNVEVGFMEGSTYPDGTPVPAVAFWNEFGVPSHNQPPRPFFRSMIAKESGSWPAEMAKQAKQTNYDGAVVLGRMGELIKGELQASIIGMTSPALKPSTIAAKGFNKPLIDTGHMKDSVAYKVND